MNPCPIKPLQLVEEPAFAPSDPVAWRSAAHALLAAGARPVIWVHQPASEGCRVRAIFAGEAPAGIHVVDGFFPASQRAYPSLAAEFPAVEYFECEMYEASGIEPQGHPWLRPVRHGIAWRKDGVPYGFYRVAGEEVHEVGVGPVHAGVIEPGHFRFQCHGEEILHLEIQLGYQHRGVLRLLPRQPLTKQLVMVESIAGDSVIAHALAFCAAVETLARHKPSLRDQAIRGIAAELERIAIHLATLSGVAIDIGFALPAAALGDLRTMVINLSAEICGSRFGRGWLTPGGVRFDLDEASVEKARQVLHQVSVRFSGVEALLFQAPSSLARLEETGVVTTALAREVGLVGLTARASGLDRDVRADFPYGIYRYSSLPSPTLESGDVYARAKLRALEIQHSIRFVLEQIEHLPAAHPKLPLPALTPNAFALSLVEGHRGEVAYVLATDAAGEISLVSIKEPSFHNWHGLALAVRENGISDFPLCNKSFDLSYAGHDL